VADKLKDYSTQIIEELGNEDPVRCYFRAFATFLKQERRRHLRDIEQIDRDLAALEDDGIVPVDVPEDFFVKVS
jgi:hypothetical protein